MTSRVPAAAADGRRCSGVTWAGFVWRNLWRRPARTALTAAGVAIGVGLIVALLSIAAGVRNTAIDLIHIGRADFGVFQEGASDLTRSLLPESLDEKDRRHRRRRRGGRHLPPRHRGGRTRVDARLRIRPDAVPGPQRLVIVAGRRPQGRRPWSATRRRGPSVSSPAAASTVERNGGPGCGPLPLG